MNIWRIAEHLRKNWGRLHRTRLEVWTYSQDTLFPQIQAFTWEVWLAYSAPLPSNHKQLRSLFLMCCCIAVSIGGLFYRWMFSSLQYSFRFSAATAAAVSLLALLTLFLVHPARCMFTMIVPTLGTKQGRRLLLSACFMIVAVNITPNILSNIQAILQVIKCICKNSSKSVLTSTHLLGNASWDFSHYLKGVINYMPSQIVKPGDGHIQFETHNNSFLLSRKMITTSQGIKEDFSHVEMLAQKAALLSNRVVAGFFLFYLIFESAWYLKNYLTDLQFDNIYITKKLEDLAQKNQATHLLVCSPKKLIKPTGLKLTREELMTCLRQMILITLMLILTLVIIATDYIAFHLAQATVTEVSRFPAVPIKFQIKYDVKLTWLKFLGKIFNDAFPTGQVIAPFESSYHQNLTVVSANCSLKWPCPPNPSVIFAVGLLYCIIYAMIFLETYSHRLCRKISASFFESHEDQRLQYLYRKLVRKHKRKEQKQHQQKSTVFS
ncbi:osteoclast stimulatory transmembrane protein [Eublepharis macularius]|uniref:Osteoclast stimulatory transmembrane protein n=1 Tax=Eublepharis macularius TaxID=481883 RepID=A0AA97L175_EUBMA|nr:osteoclast stimulatory transmembrane protein [Eublepharis macularius]